VSRTRREGKEVFEWFIRVVNVSRVGLCHRQDLWVDVVQVFGNHTPAHIREAEVEVARMNHMHLLQFFCDSLRGVEGAGIERTIAGRTEDHTQTGILLATVSR
jgi:hypothetical protein